MSRHRSPVSLLAPVVSPAQRRLDCWHSLEVAAQRLSTAAASGASLEEPSAAVAALLDELDYERFWVFPGQATVARLRELLKNRDVLMLRELASRAVHRLSEFGEAGSVFDLDQSLADQFNPLASGRHFVTVLLADDTPEDIPRSLAAELRRLGDGGHDIEVGLLMVGSVEEALAAIAVNDEIQACIIRRDLTLRAATRSPLFDTLMDLDAEPCVDPAGNGIRCGQWIRQLRPHLDL